MSYVVTKRQEKSDKEVVKKGRQTAPVQIEKELAHRIAVIATHDGKTQSDLISPQLRQFVNTHYERVQKEIQENVRKMKSEE